MGARFSSRDLGPATVRKAETTLGTPDIPGQIPDSEENKPTQLTGTGAGNQVGQTIVFCRLSRVAARGEPDRPPKTMVCPTSGSPEHGST
jgi:hypothetical protein